MLLHFMRVAFFNSHEVAGGAFPGKWIYLCYGKFWMRNIRQILYGCTENRGKRRGRNPPKVVGRKIRQKPRTWGAQLVISFSEYLYDTGRVPDPLFLFSSQPLFVCKFSDEGKTNHFFRPRDPRLNIVGVLYFVDANSWTGYPVGFTQLQGQYQRE